MSNIFLALPHSGTLVTAALPGLMTPCEPGGHEVFITANQSSLLAHNFNKLWAQALNQRAERGLRYFAMHHADVAAPEGWLDVLVAELEHTGADLLSVVVPIKDGRGLTSTGVMKRDGRVRRLTMKEIMDLPETFGPAEVEPRPPHPPLVVNTGLWICRLDQDWVGRVCFSMDDAVRQLACGRFVVNVLSEDWKFSLALQALGLKVMATRKVAVKHFGLSAYTNDEGWGSWDTDRGDC